MVEFEIKDGIAIIPEGTTVIAERAFEGRADLTGIRLPSSLRTIQPFAFRDCTGLTSIDFPLNLKEIGKYAFAGCCSYAVVKSTLQFVVDSVNAYMTV